MQILKVGSRISDWSRFRFSFLTFHVAPSGITEKIRGRRYEHKLNKNDQYATQSRENESCCHYLCIDVENAPIGLHSATVLETKLDFFLRAIDVENVIKTILTGLVFHLSEPLMLKMQSSWHQLTTVLSLMKNSEKTWESKFENRAFLEKWKREIKGQQWIYRQSPVKNQPVKPQSR